MTTAAAGAPGSAPRYLHSLWLLSARDLKVRYSTSALGYLWSILDPLVMSAIYWFVFTLIFQRDGVGGEPYIVFLLVGLLPWVWFNASVIDFTKAFRKDAKLVRSTAIPRSIWVGRIVLSKGIEFLFSIPVLILYALFAQPRVQWNPLILLFPLGIVAGGAPRRTRSAGGAAVRALGRPGADHPAHPPRPLLRVAHHLRTPTFPRHSTRSPSSTPSRESSRSTAPACFPRNGTRSRWPSPRRCRWLSSCSALSSSGASSRPC